MRSGRAFRSCLSVLLAATVAAGGATAAAAEPTGERILSFQSDLQVHADGWITVRETIQVVSEGKKIRHGIYRDLPVRFTGRDRRRMNVPFQVVFVRRDGNQEGFHTERHRNCQRIYMGRKDVLLPPGVYTYELTYRVGRLLSHSQNHDELYLHVTGNEWNFPIDAAAAMVTLPKGVPAGKIRHKVFIENLRETGKASRSHMDSSGRAIFAATRKLKNGEGLTIVVTWPKGHVAEPAVGMEFVKVDDQTRAVAKKVGIKSLPPGACVVVRRILQGSPAHAAGVKKWDVISTFGGTVIKDTEILHETISKAKLGKPLPLVILRMDAGSATGNAKWKRHSLKIVPVAMRQVIRAARQCPLKLVDLRLGRDDKKVPTVALTVKNVSREKVVGYTCRVYCFNKDDQPVKHAVSGGVALNPIAQRPIKPGQSTGGDWVWTLESRKTTTKISVVLERVRLADGSEWTLYDRQTVSIQGQWKD